MAHRCCGFSEAQLRALEALPLIMLAAPRPFEPELDPNEGEEEGVWEPGEVVDFEDSDEDPAVALGLELQIGWRHFACGS